MNQEDIAQLQEELQDARAQLEGLQVAVADREAKALHLESQLAEARQDLEARDEAVGTLRTQAEALEATVRASAERYRTLALERSPELPEELVGGTTVDEIDQAIERARETVMKVRGHLEAHALSARVPVGAPARSERDISALSAEQKIARGIEERRAS